MVSLFGYGTANMIESDIEKALEAGCRHLDCARFYGNEDLVGRCLSRFLATRKDVKRSDFFITSKACRRAGKPGFDAKRTGSSRENTPDLW